MFAVLAGWKAALLLLGALFIFVGVPVGIGLAIGIPLRRRVRRARDGAFAARAPELYEKNLDLVCRCIGGLLAVVFGLMLLFSVYDPLATAAEHKQQSITYQPSVHVFFPVVVLFGLLFLLRGRHARAVFLSPQRPDVTLLILLLAGAGICLGLPLHFWFQARMASYGYKPIGLGFGYVLAASVGLGGLMALLRALRKRPKSDDTP
jgi:hypothetical protein